METTLNLDLLHALLAETLALKPATAEEAAYLDGVAYGLRVAIRAAEETGQ